MQPPSDRSGWHKSAVGGVSATLATFPRSASWFTGKQPHECAGWCGVEGWGVLRSLPLMTLEENNVNKEDVLAYFDNTWTLTEVLFSGLIGEEAFLVLPNPLRHPLIFYYGHVAVLYVNKLLVGKMLSTPVDRELERIFETGVDEMSFDDMSKNENVWPSLERVHAYRKAVYKIVRAYIGCGAAGLWYPLAMCFEHERIHLETSSVLMRELPLRLLCRPEQWPDMHPATRVAHEGSSGAAAQFVKIAGGKATLGKAKDFPSFGWDNEYGSLEVNVPEFEVQDRLVSNGDFMEFVTSGGYGDPDLWTKTGWAWRSFRNVKWPHFWIPTGPQGLHEYVLRHTHETTALRLDLPVVVNCHEATAYCNWLARREGSPCRLPTEAEYRLMRGSSEGDFAMFCSGASLRGRVGAPNAQLAYGSESPVDADDRNELGLRGLRGNVWQWCCDLFSAFPGFATNAYYEDFSTPCFDGKHHLIMGGSWISTGDLISDFARYAFRPHFFQHAGFRVCRSQTPAPVSHAHSRGPFAAGWEPRVAGSADSTGKGYESLELVNMYLGLHYGSASDVMDERLLKFVPGAANLAEFPRRCVVEAVRVAKSVGAGCERALDVGCATGGATFAFAEHFDQVVGVDLSCAFIRLCEVLKERGEAEYQRPLEGQLTERVTARVPVSAEVRSRCTFRVMDACSLSPELGSFDCVLLGNLLCRLPSPKACLERMGGSNGLVKIGGVLFITTPFTWLESCTPLSSWLGGYVGEGGQARLSLDGLREMLTGFGFEMVDEVSLPLVIRETSRKYQLIVPNATAWKRVH